MKNLKAYNEGWINNKYILEKMESWENAGVLPASKLEKANEKLKVGYKNYNIFAKIGLFIFTWIALSSVGSILALFIFRVINESETALKFLSIITGLLLFVLLEIIIKKGNFYRSGADNLLLYTATSTLTFGLFFILGLNFELEYYFLIAAIVLSLVTIRYGDPFVSLCFFVAIIGFIFSVVTKSEIGKMIIPFLLMSIAAVISFVNDKWLTSIYYHSCHKVFKTCALILFYVSGNYFVVREGNAFLAGLSDSIEIPYYWLFWIFTFGVPIFYLVFSLRNKDRLMLHLGILAVAASLFTFHNYYPLLPIEIEICIIGVILVLSSVLLSRWLKIERKGITSLQTKGNKDAEGLIINELIQNNLGNNPNQDGFEFSGGNFGGGGAGSGY
ncbi:hypothetical protein SAMN06298216_2486 [Spirosomataceae bacterium TFI 002]|nr:hypothetical protein SAMN06298216_2486 [Spirosomataceae bacterium TFI 002]